MNLPVLRAPRIATLILLAAFLLPLASAAFAATEKRVALVIGNGAYMAVGTLTNPANDARAIARKLRILGFDTVEATDADDGAMKRAIRDFAARLDGADVGLFFYAGHGIQLDGVNYLLSINAEIQVEDDVNYGSTAFPIDAFLRPLDDKAKIRIVILDACRNNPFVAELQRAMGARAVAVGQGLARIEPGSNRLIAYSTEPGKTASDGAGTNSPFTAALLRNIDKPGVSFGDMMADVTAEVADATHQAQIPSIIQSLTSRFYMAPGAAPASATAPAAGAAVAAAAAAPAAAAPDAAGEDALWALVQNATDPNDVQYYLDVYPAGRYVAAARFKLEKLRGQSTMVASLTPAGDPAAAAPGVAAPAAASPAVAAPALAPVAGRKAESTIDIALPGSPVTEATFSRADRIEIQGRLASLGYPVGGADGSLGPRSRTAITNWQVAIGAVPNGYMTNDQMVKLRLDSLGVYETWLAEQQRLAAARQQVRRAPRQQQQPHRQSVDPTFGAFMGGLIGGAIGGAIGR